jgi:hypothetical protein
LSGQVCCSASKEKKKGGLEIEIIMYLSNDLPSLSYLRMLTCGRKYDISVSLVFRALNWFVKEN